MSDTNKLKGKMIIEINTKGLVFFPLLKSPKPFYVLADPEVTILDLKKFILKKYFSKFEKFLPFNIYNVDLRPMRCMSAFGLRDHSTIGDTVPPDVQTDCCSGGTFCLKASLNQGLPGGRANLEEKEKWFVVRSTNLEAPIRFKSFRLSCSSHVFAPDTNYAGVVLYAYQGQTEWRLNGQHCKSGYTIILDTEKLREMALEEEWPVTEGAVHGLVFYYLFRCGIGRTIGEGFAIMRGDVRWNSTTFNARDDGYHDRDRIISESGKKMLDELIRVWRLHGEVTKSLPPNKTFEL